MINAYVVHDIYSHNFHAPCLYVHRCPDGDHVSFYEDMGSNNRENFILTETFCGNYTPGPYATSRLLKMVFHSDDSVSHVGFKASYEFIHQHQVISSK